MRMPDLSRQQHWDAVYGTKAEDEVSWFEASPRISLELIRRSGVHKTSPIIDIGGGVSRLPASLMAAGYSDVTVLDVSAEAIARLTERQVPNGAVKGIVADVTTWQPDRAYWLWHDRAVLQFLTDEADRESYRETLLRALAPGGQAIIATFAPSGPERCSGLPVRRYGAAEIEAFAGSGFTMQESFEFDHTTPAGLIQRFHVARLMRRRPMLHLSELA
jgi:SAM-dependent methyltransferase